MHETNSFVYDRNHVSTNLRVNQTTWRSVSLAGDAIEGSCNTGTYSDRFGTWSRVNLQAVIKITLTAYNTKVDLRNDKILLSSGLGCKFSELTCVDSENGYTFWNMFQALIAWKINFN